MTSQGLFAARNAGLRLLVMITGSDFDSGHFELFNFPRRRLLRPAFLAGIKPCDIIMHKYIECKGTTRLTLS